MTKRIWGRLIYLLVQFGVSFKLVILPYLVLVWEILIQNYIFVVGRELYDLKTAPVEKKKALSFTENIARQ